MSCYTLAAKRALAIAVRYAENNNDGYIGTTHLLLGLLGAKSEDGTPCIAAKLLCTHTVTTHAIETLLSLPQTEIQLQTTNENMLTQIIADAKDLFTPVVKRILTLSEVQAERFTLERNHGKAVIGTEHILFSLLCENDAAAHHALTCLNLPLHELYGDVLSFLSAITAEEAIFSGKSDSIIDTPSDPVPSRRKSAGAENQTHPYLYDMTEAAAAGKYDAVVGRETEEENVLRILLHRQKNNPCLLGEAGVGKTAIVEGLAARISHGDVPAILRGAVIYALDLGAMLAGAKYRGEFEERLKSALSFCQAQQRIAILFIDELHMLMGAGAAEGGADAANLLKPALSRGQIRIIGATTREEYDKSIGRDGAMNRRFQTVTVEEPSEDNAFRMLQALRPRLEEHHSVRISDETLRCAVAVSVRCLPGFYLPDKAIDLLDDACAAVSTQNTAKTHSTPQQMRDEALLSGNLQAAQMAVQSASSAIETTVIPSLPAVVPQDILSAVQRRTGIAVTADADTDQKYLTLEKTLGARIFGQEEAIAAIAAALRRSRSGLHIGTRPMASFLFFGPTGVGKTAMCQALAELLFDTPHAFLRFDMTEYREAHTVSRLIGAPPGYIGHEDGGRLTSAIRHRPYALVLFDEIEKAHPDVRRLFLQMLDNGTLTDSRGNAVSFRHTIIVMTANSETSAPRSVGFGAQTDTEDSNRTLHTLFEREFLARFDAVIPFRPLTEEIAHRILALQLSAIAEQLAARSVTLTIDDAVLPFLYRKAPSEHGARGYQQTAARYTEAPISQALLDGTLVSGSHAVLSVGDDQLILQNE